MYGATSINKRYIVFKMKNPIITARLKRRALAQQLSESDNYIIIMAKANKLICNALTKQGLSLIGAFLCENDYAKEFIFEYIKQYKQITNEQTDDNSTVASAERDQAAQDNQPQERS